MTSRVQAVHLVNQFFGGLGGEERADEAPQVRHGALGPGRGLEAQSNGRLEIARTIIVGDNYANDYLPDVLERVLATAREAAAQVFVAGPAFNAGRYGVTCGETCKAVAQQIGIPSVTAMHPDNPAVETFRRTPHVWIIPTGESAADMSKTLPRLASFAVRLAEGEQLGPARQEAYLPTGLRRLTAVNRPASDRAIDMLLAKLSGAAFVTEIPVERFEQVPPAPPLSDLKHARLAVVTTSGLVPHGNPDGFKVFNATQWRTYTLPAGDLRGEEWDVIHGGFNTVYAQANPNLVVPLDALRDLQATGAYGFLHEQYYSITGVGTALQMARRAGEEMAESMRDAGIDAALLVAT